MKKNLIIYYSRTGNNKFLATKIQHELGCDIEEIKPRFNSLIPLIFASTTRLSMGVKNINHNIGEYDNIIFCGPTWMGTIIAPFRDFIKKYNKKIKSIYFLNCCGSSDEKSNEKFGYNTVYPQIEKIFGNRAVSCEPFPIDLIIPQNKKDDDDFIMKARLTDENFTGEITTRFNNFLQKVK